jgi:hypothetical protein
MWPPVPKADSRESWKVPIFMGFRFKQMGRAY